MRLVGLSLVLSLAAAGADLRVGLIGTDTSHVTAFTKIFNDASAPDHVPGVRVVAAWKGGSPDLPESSNRVEKYAEELRTRWNVELVPRIGDLCGKVDGLLLTSVDGRTHLEQARQALACRVPLFIDKPLAATLADAREIARLASEAGVPWFSSSSLRFSQIVTDLRSPENTGAATWGPGPLEEHHPLELAWYAIHPIEMLYALMGPGCERVARTSTADADVVVGTWKGGRIGVVRALRPYSAYGAVVFRPKQIVESTPEMKTGYGPLLVEIEKFFRTRVPPVSNAETLELFAFLDAAQRSKASGGRPEELR